MIRIVEDASKVSGRQATVVVEGNDIPSITDMDARKEVLSWASSKGLSRPGISSNNGAYPVKADGTPIETVAANPDAKYRADYTVTSGI